MQKRVKSMMGVVISEASLLKFVLRLHQALETWELQATEQILKAHAINVDETSLRVDKKNYWIHGYSSGDITLKYLHRKRGTEAIEAINIMNSVDVDLILLDVEMPKMTGIDFLKTSDKHPLIILITSKKEYAVEAFEYNVVDYIVKPVKTDRLLKSLIKAKGLIEKTNTIEIRTDSNYIFVRENGVLHKIDTTEILYIKALGDYLTIFTNHKTYTLHQTLKSFLDKMANFNFLRVHRSYIIAIDKINKVEEGTVYLEKHSIPIGDTYRAELLKKINIL